MKRFVLTNLLLIIVFLTSVCTGNTAFAGKNVRIINNSNHTIWVAICYVHKLNPGSFHIPESEMYSQHVDGWTRINPHGNATFNRGSESFYVYVEAENSKKVPLRQFGSPTLFWVHPDRFASERKLPVGIRIYIEGEATSMEHNKWGSNLQKKLPFMKGGQTSENLKRNGWKVVEFYDIPSHIENLTISIKN